MSAATAPSAIAPASPRPKIADRLMYGSPSRPPVFGVATVTPSAVPDSGYLRSALNPQRGEAHMVEPYLFGVLRYDSYLDIHPGEIVRVWFSLGLVKCGDRVIATNYGWMAGLCSDGHLTWITRSQDFLPAPERPRLRLMA